LKIIIIDAATSEIRRKNTNGPSRTKLTAKKKNSD